MRITESRLRQIIREEAGRALGEMAYAGSLGIVHGDPRNLEDYNDDDFVPNLPGVEKFARSGRFQTLAQKHLENIPHDVWFATLAGALKDIDYGILSGGRLAISPLVPDGLRKLRELGFKVRTPIGRRDTVILYTSMMTDPGPRQTIATPWVIFHSMFDDGYAPESMDDTCPSFAELRSVVEKHWKGIRPALTMRSAREGLIGGPGDVAAEIMCQELLTKGGLRLDQSKIDPGLREELPRIESIVKRVAAEFRRNVRGKLIAVAVD